MTVQHVWGYDPISGDIHLESKGLPELKDNDILVRNCAIGINPVDWKFIRNNPRNWCKGHIPGVDGAGIIIDVGSSVEQSLIGRRVAYHASLNSNGSFSEYTALRFNRVMYLPDEISFQDAASLPCPLLTAWQAFRKLPLNEHCNVLLSGFGTVNYLLLQLLVNTGHTVDVMSSSLDEEEGIRLGVRNIFRNSTKVSEKYFAVVDAVGENTAAKLACHLKANGHLVCIQDRVSSPVDPAFTRAISYHEVALGALHDYGDVDDWSMLMKSAEELLCQIAQFEIIVPRTVFFAFAKLKDALKHSEYSKRKTVVILN